MAILTLTRSNDAAQHLAAELKTELLVVVSELPEALEKLTASWSLVLVDADFAGGAALELVEKVSQRGHKVAVVTRTPSLDLTLNALRRGARDVLTFPVSAERVRELSGQGAELVEAGPERGELVGWSSYLARTRETIDNVGQVPVPVVIEGESGTGKHLVARILHERSGRPGSFVTVDCAALSAELLEAELFGPDTPPQTRLITYGPRIRSARAGTLLLDSVEQLSPVLQARLAQVIQDGSEPAVAGTSEVGSVRWIGCSEVSLAEEVAAGGFRPELFYELAVVLIQLPPLRARPEDIEPLARHFLSEFAERFGKPVRDFHTDAIGALLSFPWPGNVRQLRAVTERAVAIARGDTVLRSDLSLELFVRREVIAPDFLTLEQVERDHIRRALDRSGGRISEAADMLGIHRNTLRRKLQAFGIVP